MPAGAELRHAREQAGLSAEQVSERTKIQLHKIEALENGNFGPLPEGIYLDGLVRAYAHEVGIDTEPMLERVHRERALFVHDREVALGSLSAFQEEAAAPSPAAAPITIDPKESAPAEWDAPGALNQDIPRPSTHPRRQFGQLRSSARSSSLALPLLALLAIGGWGAYLYQVRKSPESESVTRDAAASSQQTKSPDDATSQSSPAPSPDVRQDDQTNVPSDRTSTAGSDRRATSSVAAGAAKRETEVNLEPPAPARGRPIPDTSRSTPRPPIAPPPAAAAATSARDLSGLWRLATTVEASSLNRYSGLKLGYDIQLNQAGDRVTGTGRKVTENGAGVRGRARTPIAVAGTIDGDRVTLTFTEKGTRRPTQGKFILVLDEGGTMRGRFSSSAASSSGTVEARRSP